MTPNLERAATAAAKILIQHRVTSAPVAPLRILKSQPGVIVLSFTELASGLGVERNELLSQYGDMNRDAYTLAKEVGGQVRYFVAYNMLLPDYLLQRAIARELGHIVLGHDGSRPEDVRQEEAKCFAHHLMCPRPLIHAISASNLRVTEDLVRNIAGCPDHCMSCIRRKLSSICSIRRSSSSGCRISLRGSSSTSSMPLRVILKLPLFNRSGIISFWMV